jgi:hypothetical protein
VLLCAVPISACLFQAQFAVSELAIGGGAVLEQIEGRGFLYGPAGDLGHLGHGQAGSGLVRAGGFVDREEGGLLPLANPPDPALPHVYPSQLVRVVMGEAVEVGPPCPDAGRAVGPALEARA